MGKQLSAAQEKLRVLQVEKNSEYINSIDLLLNEIEPFVEESINYNKYLLNFYEQLNNAHGMLMQGEYANLYTKDFNSASSPAIGSYFEISDDFEVISEEQKSNFLNPLPNPDEFQQRINYFFDKIKPLFEDSYSENSFIIRFEGMESVYEEFKKIANQYWHYPKELTLREATHNREFIAPISLHGVTRVYPFHVKVYVDYSQKFNTVFLFKSKLQNLRRLLKTINAQLPFAELNEKVPQIQNVVTGYDDKSISLGENVKIGKNNAIGDSASVKEK